MEGGRRALVFLGAAALLGILAAFAGVVLRGGSAAGLHFVGSEACVRCHALEANAWRRSHHAQAMQPASPDSVLGDFSGVSFADGNGATRFLHVGTRFIARTSGPDGAVRDETVTHTIGVYPLQQYLVAAPGGRLQALTIAWDARPRMQGGQRWFSLYPGQIISGGDPLHWRSANFTWNTMCADCHVTGFARNFDPAERSFASHWAEVDVGCEGCHGPGSSHLAWAAKPMRAADPARGFVSGGTPGIDVCGLCHARRRVIASQFTYGRPLLDNVAPDLLDEGEYYADGRVEQEDFEYGSFLQSRMARAGVTCSDCHDPHTARLRAEGNALCARCHEPARYDTVTHHHHVAGGAGAACAACHMPSRTYMVIHVRHDHAIRVPRPDRALGPDPCTTCHAGRSRAWASAAIAGWTGRRAAHSDGAATIAAGREGRAGASEALAALARDAGAASIVRATALGLLSQQSAGWTPSVAGAVRQGAGASDPLVRMAAADAAGADPEAAAGVLVPLLRDPVRAVRIAAARGLAPLAGGGLPVAARADFAAAAAELMASDLAEADRPEGEVAAGALAAAMGDLQRASRAYDLALALSPGFAPALINRADLLRIEGRDAEARDILEALIARKPGDAEAQHALGLLLIRQGSLALALPHLRAAAASAPRNVHYAYVLDLALQAADTGAR